MRTATTGSFISASPAISCRCTTTTTTTTTTHPAPTLRPTAFRSRHRRLPFNMDALFKELLQVFDCKAPVFVQKICKLNCARPPSFRRREACKVQRAQVKIEDSIEDEACELVNGVDLSVGEGADSINAHLFTAVKNNNRTGILLLSDVFGFEDSATRDFAYRVACNGYNVLVPDLFRGDPWGKDRPKDLYESWRAKQNLQRVQKDIAASVKWMVDEFVAAGISKKLGILGFCYGGGRVIDVLAEDHGGHFGLGVSFYGTRIDKTAAANVNVPVLFITGNEDPLCPVADLQDVERSIGKGSRVEIFEGRGHGFAHRPQSPEEDKDAEKAFTIMRNWLYNGLVAEN